MADGWAQVWRPVMKKGGSRRNVATVLDSEKYFFMSPHSLTIWASTPSTVYPRNGRMGDHYRLNANCNPAESSKPVASAYFCMEINSYA